MHLSRRALVTAGNTMLLVDALLKVYVYYGTAAQTLERPPRGCK